LKLRSLLFFSILLVTGTQLNAGYLCQNKYLQSIVPAGFVIGGILTAPEDNGTALLVGCSGLACVGIRRYLGSQGTQTAEVGLKIVQVAIPAFLAGYWYSQKYVTTVPAWAPEYAAFSRDLDQYKKMAKFWLAVNAGATIAEAALQICC